MRTTALGAAIAAAASLVPSSVHASPIDYGRIARERTPGLEVARVVEVRGGAVVHLEQRYALPGLRVVGGGATVRVGDDGRVRWAADRTAALPAEFDVHPALSPARAVELALGRPEPRAATELVIYARPRRAARLAYRVDLPASRRFPRAPRLYVDATDGTVLGAGNRARTGTGPTANVWEHNPIDTPDPIVAPLSGLAVDATSLTTADLSVSNCLDENTCSEVFGAFMHTCVTRATAAPNAGGQFTDYVFESDTSRDDTFAEIQAYYHAAKVYDATRALGLTDLSWLPLYVVVNYTFPDFGSFDLCDGPTYTGSAPLEPFDNAFFTPDGDAFGVTLPSAGIVFGQGSATDFAYDGDVVYHEFGHAIMNTIATLGFGYVDEYGYNPLPGALHEGYADLVTLWITDDPEVGEYASLNFGEEAIRDLSGDNTCPRDLVGEGHEDGLPFTAAIYAARLQMADAQAFDAAVLAAQAGFGEFTGFAEAAELTLAEVETALGAAARDTLRQELEARGATDCNGRVFDATAATKEQLFVLGNDWVPMPTVPAVIQLRYELTAPATELHVDVAQLEPLFGTPADLDVIVLLKSGGEPIMWTNAALTGADHERAQPLAVQGGAAAATFGGGFAAGVYHLQLFNRGASAMASSLAVSHTADPSMPDAGAAPDAGQAGGDGDSGGCGCRAVRPGGSLAALLLLALWAVSQSRVRRRMR